MVLGILEIFGILEGDLDFNMRVLTLITLWGFWYMVIYVAPAKLTIILILGILWSTVAVSFYLLSPEEVSRMAKGIFKKRGKKNENNK